MGEVWLATSLLLRWCRCRSWWCWRCPWPRHTRADTGAGLLSSKCTAVRMKHNPKLRPSLRNLDCVLKFVACVQTPGISNLHRPAHTTADVTAPTSAASIDVLSNTCVNQ